MPGWYSVNFGVAAAKSACIIPYLNTSVNFNASLKSKSKAWQTPLLLMKVLITSCSSRFKLLTLLCRKFQRIIFYPPLNCFEEKPQNICFKLPVHAKQLPYQFQILRNIPILLQVYEVFADLFYGMNVWSSLGWMD